MRLETSLIDRKNQQFCELRQEKNSKSKKNRRRNKKSNSMLVQRLFETCWEVFATSGAGTVPSARDVERLRSVLDSMQPVDVGLTPSMPYFRETKTGGAPLITYLHLYECDRFSIGIFCLPPSGVIPLHNHPGMTVFSKLLFGSVHIKSYDWAVDMPYNNGNENIKPSHFQPPEVQLAKVKIDANFVAPCNASILYPAAGGNMHCFTALTSCAVLDVLGPPYSDSEGRHCTYYHDFPYSNFSDIGEMGLVPEDESKEYGWLEEREKPESFVVVGALYEGPMIVDT